MLENKITSAHPLFTAVIFILTSDEGPYKRPQSGDDDRRRRTQTAFTEMVGDASEKKVEENEGLPAESRYQWLSDEESVKRMEGKRWR